MGSKEELQHISLHGGWVCEEDMISKADSDHEINNLGSCMTERQVAEYSSISIHALDVSEALTTGVCQADVIVVAGHDCFGHASCP